MGLAVCRSKLDVPTHQGRPPDLSDAAGWRHHVDTGSTRSSTDLERQVSQIKQSETKLCFVTRRSLCYRTASIWGLRCE